MFKGSIVPIITPFKDGKIDLEAFERIINFQISNGSDGIIVCGSTGESALLTFEEREILITTAVNICQGRIDLVVGCGAASTQEALNHVKKAKELGANGVLVVAPFFCKPTQDGIIQHYKEISQAGELPIIVYNNPGRCGVDITIESFLAIAKFKNVVALKDSTHLLSRITHFKQHASHIAYLGGEDNILLGFMAHGGEGVISATANVCPLLIKKLLKAWEEKDIEQAQALNTVITALVHVLFKEPNPIGLKYALSLMNICENELRLPLLKASSKAQEEIKDILMELKIISHD